MRSDWNRAAGIARWAIAVAAALALGLGVVAPSAANNVDLPAVGGQIAPDFTIGEAVVVGTDRLNLRVQAGLDAEVVTVLEAGQTATVVDGPVESDGYAWYQLDAGGTVGWSASSFLAPADTGTATGDVTSEADSDVSGDLAIGGETSALAPGSTAVVNDDNVNLRAEPSLDADVLLKLDSGTTAAVLDGPVEAEGYVWYQLDVDGTVGWTAGDFLSAA